MSNLKQIRLRIKSIKSTKKITKAMQMVSASKLRKAKIAVESSLSYYDAVKCSVMKAIKSADELTAIAKIMLGNTALDGASPKLIVAYAADRGLCGGFNQNVIRMLKKAVALDQNIKIIAIGKRMIDFIGSSFPQYLVAEYTNAEMSDEKIRELSDNILSMLSSNAISSCEVYYNLFKNVLTQVPTHRQIIPFEAEDSVEGAELVGEGLLDQLMRIYLISELKQALLSSKASEEASRATAMDNATKNAGDLINDLTLVMNRQRQANITKELIEIISGASAV